MSKHTPGPWFDTGLLSEGYDWTRVVADGPISLTTIHTPEHQNAHAGEAQANANLVAAAPELLAACKEFVRFSELPDTVNRGDYIRYQVSALGAAQAAIAKAGG